MHSLKLIGSTIPNAEIESIFKIKNKILFVNHNAPPLFFIFSALIDYIIDYRFLIVNIYEILRHRRLLLRHGIPTKIIPLAEHLLYKEDYINYQAVLENILFCRGGGSAFYH